MKSRIFCDKLMKFATKRSDILDARQVALLESVAKKLCLFGEVSVAKAVGDIEVQNGSNSIDCAESQILAQALCEFRDSLGTPDKRSAARDFTALLSALEHYGYHIVHDLTPPIPVASASRKSKSRGRKTAMNKSLIDRYVVRLENSYKDPGSFREVFDELSSSSEVGRADLVEIATRFMGKIPKSSSREAALTRIRSRHDALMDLRAKKRAFGGRTAA